MNYLDDMIYRIYEKLEIEAGNVLPHNVCAKLNLILRYADEASFHGYYEGTYYIILNESKTQQEQLYDFAHELGHLCYTRGISLKVDRFTLTIKKNKRTILRKGSLFRFTYCAKSTMRKLVRKYFIMLCKNLMFLKN